MNDTFHFSQANSIWNCLNENRFLLFMGFLQQDYWSGLPFSPPGDYILPELFTVTYPSWVALHGMAQSFTELCKPLRHYKAVTQEGDNY